MKLKQKPIETESGIIAVCECGEELTLKQVQTLDTQSIRHLVALCPKCKLYHSYNILDLDDEELKEVEEWLEKW